MFWDTSLVYVLTSVFQDSLNAFFNAFFRFGLYKEWKRRPVRCFSFSFSSFDGWCSLWSLWVVLWEFFLARVGWGCGGWGPAWVCGSGSHVCCWESGLNQNMQNSESWGVLVSFLGFFVLGVKCWLFSQLNVWERRDESHICERGGGGAGGVWWMVLGFASLVSHTVTFYLKRRKAEGKKDSLALYLNRWVYHREINYVYYFMKKKEVYFCNWGIFASRSYTDKVSERQSWGQT